MIEGMDKKPMQLQRMLLMLAPMPIDETIGKILGKISGAIIMNDLNTEIFIQEMKPLFISCFRHY